MGTGILFPYQIETRCRAGSPMPDWHAFLQREAPQGRHEGLVWRLHADRRTNPIFALQALKLVGQGRLELPTSRLSSARSNQLSY